MTPGPATPRRRRKPRRVSSTEGGGVTLAGRHGDYQYRCRRWYRYPPSHSKEGGRRHFGSIHGPDLHTARRWTPRVSGWVSSHRHLAAMVLAMLGRYDRYEPEFSNHLRCRNASYNTYYLINKMFSLPPRFVLCSPPSFFVLPSHCFVSLLDRVAISHETNRLRPKS